MVSKNIDLCVKRYFGDNETQQKLSIFIFFYRKMNQKLYVLKVYASNLLNTRNITYYDVKHSV